MSIDELKIYRGNDFIINKYIKIKHPSLGDICDYGEQDYFKLVHTLCSVGADLKWQLDDLGIDYTKISDFELFCTVLVKWLNKEQTRIFFGDVLDFSNMELRYNTELKENVLIQFLQNGEYIQIDKYVYHLIVGALRKMHNFKRNNELPGNEATKMILIEDAREEYMEKMNKSQEYESILLPLISSMVNSSGFKRNETTVFDMKIYAFMDSVERTKKIKTADVLTQSGYSGFGIDIKKVDKNVLNWLGKLD